MVLQACRVFPQDRIVSRKSFNFSYEMTNNWNEYNYILYQNKSNLSTEYSTRLLFLFLCQPLLCDGTTVAEERSQARGFCCFCLELDVILFLLWARRCPPSLSAVAVDPMVPYSTHLRRWSALTGAKQHCFRTCRELVKRRWVWNQEKGNVQRHRLTRPLVPTRCDIRVTLLEH